MGATDVAQLARRVYTSLSGGERAHARVRTGVRAEQAQLLLLDEPTAALDVHHQELVLKLARHRAAEGDGVLVVLHDLAVAARHADRIVLLDGGRIVADGDPATVLDPTRLSRVYDHEIEVLVHPRTGALLVIPLSLLPCCSSFSCVCCKIAGEYITGTARLGNVGEGSMEARRVSRNP